jgi:carbonic anhydrase
MKTFAIASFASLAAAVCHHGTTLSPRSAGLAKRAEGAFGFHELEGALNWHGLDPLNELCAVGTNQSPINVNGGQTSVGGSSFSLSVNSYPSGAEFENLGTTVQVYADGSATVGGVSYNLAQFHFHTPSEHHLHGEYFPAEVHFVFQAAGKD